MSDKTQKERKHTHIGVRIETQARFEAGRKAASDRAGYKISMTEFMDQVSKLDFSSPSS